MKINVLYVIWSLGLGGAERVVISLAKGLDKTKFNPIICCLNEKGQFASELEQAGIKVIALHKKGPLDLSIIGKIRRVIRENKIDVVHTHLWGANLWGRIAAKKAKVPVIIVTEHNEDVWKKAHHFMLDRWLSKRTDAIIAVSKAVKEFYVRRGIPGSKIQVIYNGVGASGKWGQVPSSRSKITSAGSVPICLAIIGRLVRQKGHGYFLETLKALVKNHKVQGLIIGSGPMDEELRALAKSYNLNGSVKFLGLRDDVNQLLSTIDILVMPSLREGLPMVALEAMSYGIPVVGFSVGGMPEVVEDGVTGVLVAPQDNKALTAGIERLLKDRALAQRMGENARKRVEERFSLKEMINSTERLYQSCLSSKGAS